MTSRSACSDLFLPRDGSARRLMALLSLMMGLIGLVASPVRAEIGAYVVVDAGTGTVTDEKNATRLWYPASLTKMMTAYVTFKAIREGRASLNSVVVQSANSLNQAPSKMGFKVGTTLTVDTALKIVMVKSANDIAVALGEAIGGSERAFVGMMNAEAQRLGMRSTRFVNPHGLPDNAQVSSARDLALLAVALRRDFPESRDYYRLGGLEYGQKTLLSANREFLSRVPGADGLKTGYICNSGYNVAASVTRSGRTIIAVVLGGASGLERSAFARQVIDKAFRERAGSRSLASLSGNPGQPPADGYCKRNAKPGLEGLMADFDLQGGAPSGLMSFMAGRPGSVLKPGAATAPAAGGKADLSDVKLPNGEPDWKKVLDRTLGPVQHELASLRITTGVPVGAAPPRASQASDGSVPSTIPVPIPHPGRLRTGATDHTDLPVLRQGEVQAPAPGALFQPGKGFTVPVPAPEPKSGNG